MLRISRNDIRNVIGKGYKDWYKEEEEDYIQYNDEDLLDIDELDDFILLDDDEMTYECCDCDCTSEMAEEIERKYRRK